MFDNTLLYTKINDILDIYISESDCLENEFICQELKQKEDIIGYTYKAFKNLWFKIYYNMKNYYRIIIANSTYAGTNNYSDIEKIVDSESIKLLDNGTIQIDIEKDDKELFRIISILKPVLIRTYLFLCENEPVHKFACCSRFEECSDAKICIHPNRKYAKGCFYKKNLESGKIFYGKNRNIN